MIAKLLAFDFFKNSKAKALKQTPFFYEGIVKSYFTLKGWLPLNKSQKSIKSLARLYPGY